MLSLSADRPPEPASTSARTNEAKRSDLRNLEPKWLIGDIPAPACETDQTNQCRAVLPGHLPRYVISHSSGVRMCTGRAIRRTGAFFARGASVGRNVGNMAQPARNCREHLLAWRKCRASHRAMFHNEWAGESAPRRLQRIRTKGNGHAPVPLLTPSAQFLKTTAPVTG